MERGISKPRRMQGEAFAEGDRLIFMNSIFRGIRAIPVQVNNEASGMPGALKLFSSSEPQPNLKTEP